MPATGTPLALGPWQRPLRDGPAPFEGLGGRGRRLSFPPGHGRNHSLRHLRLFRFSAQSHFVYPPRPGHMRARGIGTFTCGKRGLVLPAACMACGGRHDLPARGPGRNRRPYAPRKVVPAGLCRPDEKFRSQMVLPGPHAGSGSGQPRPPRAFHRRMHYRRRRRAGHGDGTESTHPWLARSAELRHDGSWLPISHGPSRRFLPYGPPFPSAPLGSSDGQRRPPALPGERQIVRPPADAGSWRVPSGKSRSAGVVEHPRPWCAWKGVC